MNKKVIVAITVLLGMIIVALGAFSIYLVNQPAKIKVVEVAAPPLPKTEIQVSNCSVYKNGERLVTYRAFVYGSPIEESGTYVDGQSPVVPETHCVSAGVVTIVDTELEALSAFAAVEPGAVAPQVPVPSENPGTGGCAGIGCKAAALLTVKGSAGLHASAAAAVSPVTGSEEEPEAVETAETAPVSEPADSTPEVSPVNPPSPPQIGNSVSVEPTGRGTWNCYVDAELLGELTHASDCGVLANYRMGVYHYKNGNPVEVVKP